MPKDIEIKPDTARHDHKVANVSYTVILEPDTDGLGYTVTVPSLPGCITEGDSFREAMAHAEEAIAGYLEALQKMGEPIPPGDRPKRRPIREEVAVTVPVA